MPSASFDSGALCFQVPALVELLGVGQATRCEWQVVGRPPGAQVVIEDPLAPTSTTIEVSQDGTYSFQVCCFYDETQNSGDDQPTTGIEVPDRLFCPRAVVAGDTAQIIAFGCEDATIEWSFTSGPVTSVTGNTTSATVTTDPNASGVAIITATCTRVDVNGTEVVQNLACPVTVLPADSELDCVTSAAVEVEFINCGESCDCFDFTMVFDCENGMTCSEDVLGFTVKQCPPTPNPDEDCEELVRVEVTGVPAFLAPCNDSIDCCDYSICCDDHRPQLLWNSLCNCPGWTFQAPAIEGSDFHNACGCTPGQRWCFEDSATIVASGPQQFVDVMVIWGHNLQNGIVTTSPLAPFGGGPTGVGIVNDNACIEGYSEAVVINFDQPPENGITDLEINIDSNGQGIVCIDQVFIGQKFFLPDDLLPASFVNPHDGDDYELEVKESECGILSRSTRHTPCDFSLEICADDDWLCEHWRPFLRYARRHGFMFQWSRNRKPNDIINAWIPNKVPGSRWQEDGTSIITLPARGFITPPQIPLFVE